MRGARKLFYIAISIGLATLGFATPLVAMIVGALMPDPEELIIRQAVEREVGLAPDFGTLDDAYLRDVPGPPPQTPEPGEDARAAAAAGAKGATKAGGGKGSKKQKCVDPTPGIALVGDNEYSVDRQIILDLANDLERASHLAWTGWAYNDKGKTIGFTVKKIRCGSILDQVGLKNGDIIHEINGKNVTSITQAFGAWRKVCKKDLVRVKITRKGEKMEMRYHVE